MAANKSHYMPSEVARLVLGYLKENKCPTAAEAFMEESKHLAEYKDCLAEGIEYPLKIGEKNLLQILNRPSITRIEPKPTSSNSVSCDKSPSSCLLPPPPTTPRRTPSKASSSCIIKSNSQRVTPRKNETPRKLTRADTSLRIVQLASSCNNEKENNSGSSNSDLDRTLTPSKQNSVHVDPNLVVGELINNPAMSEKLAEAVNKILGCGANSSSMIENLTSGSWSAIAAPELQPCPQQHSATDDFVPEPNDESINLPADTVQNIMSELEKDPVYSQFINGVMSKLDLDEFSSICGSSPIASTTDVISSSLATPKSEELYRHDHSCYASPAEFCNYASSPDVVKNLFKTPIKGYEASATHAVDDQFNSSPFACASSPFVEPPITPGKLVTLDFEMLTASPQHQQLLHASHRVLQSTSGTQYISLMPTPIALSSTLVPPVTVLSPFKRKHIVPSNLLDEALKANHRKILPKGKQIQADTTIQPKRKATEREIRELLAAKPKIAPRGSRNGGQTSQPNYVTGRPKKRATPAIRSLNFTDQSAADMPIFTKEPSSNEPKQATRTTSTRKAKSPRKSIAPSAIAVNAAQLDLLKNIDSDQINEIISRVHTKSS